MNSPQSNQHILHCNRWLGMARLSCVAALCLLAASVPAAAAATYTVSSLADTDHGACASACTLRDALTAADATPGATITFSVTGTINLLSALPAISAPVVIQGPGAKQLTVRRSTTAEYRIFTITAPDKFGNGLPATGVVSISGLTIRNGDVTTLTGIGEDGSGGGIANHSPGTLNVSDCVISGNSAEGGGAIVNWGQLNITRSSITSNSTTNVGGGIYQPGSGTTATTITESTISGNVTAGDGGGIWAIGPLTINKSTVSGNSAGDFRYGGGIELVTPAIAIIDTSTIAGNSAGFAGGGIADFGSILALSNSTVTGNTVSPLFGLGGGIYNPLASTPDAVLRVNLKSTIVALNAREDLNGPAVSLGYNVLGPVLNTGAIISLNVGDQFDVIATDLKLGPLQENGGPTQTIALGCGSVAIDQGLRGVFSYDQRGTDFLRIFDDPAIANASGGDGADVGAFEVESACTGAPVATTTTLVSSLNPSTVGQSVTLTATVTGAYPYPTGVVTFLDGANAVVVDQLVNGSASLTTTAFTIGSHTITASYGSDASNAPSTSSPLVQVVHAATSTTTLTSSLNPSTVGQPVTFTATVTGFTPTRTVTFLDGGSPIQTVSLAGGNASLTASALTIGSHTITASFGGDANNSGSISSAVVQVVNPQTPAQMVATLIATVRAMNIPQQGTSLTDQLQQVATDIATKNGLACQDLAAFAHHINAQIGRSITAAQANQILAAVASLEASLNCT